MPVTEFSAQRIAAAVLSEFGLRVSRWRDHREQLKRLAVALGPLTEIPTDPVLPRVVHHNRRLLATELFRRWDALREEHGFDPRLGYVQVEGGPTAVVVDFGRFEALEALLDHYDLWKLAEAPQPVPST